METDIILKKLTEIEKMISQRNYLQKEVLNFREACEYINVSASHLYKLTSAKKVPHYCPKGKMLYFNRHELDEWLQQNKQRSREEIEQIAVDYVTINKKKL